MKTYQEFIKEDFNSPKATQISLPIMSHSRGAAHGVMTFFEALPKRSFNLLRYLKSFDTGAAKDVLDNSMGYWRAMIYSANQELLVFVWKGTILHHQIGKALETVSGTGKVPSHKYIKAYNTMSILDPGEDIGNNWCFPVVYGHGQIRTNLSPTALDELVKQKGVKELFQFDTTQFTNLLKDDM